eukprot:gnl/TRDRNA2_/TRDRNA2_128315_c0_seq1.p1 gnl/TRDRNA2_/TRDRNA2_128315_c0~~gnl/TRDRNA2_/TRDRNA2_128315_c0_seq1.p1  ORF type:complete len:468 (-),score=52.00 gnl/TRDRNA2_/TRDRNA2_128315_c0_seq1:64-1467(-)
MQSQFHRPSLRGATEDAMGSPRRFLFAGAVVLVAATLIAVPGGNSNETQLQGAETGSDMESLLQVVSSTSKAASYRLHPTPRLQIQELEKPEVEKNAANKSVAYSQTPLEALFSTVVSYTKPVESFIIQRVSFQSVQGTFATTFALVFGVIVVAGVISAGVFVMLRMDKASFAEGEDIREGKDSYQPVRFEAALASPRKEKLPPTPFAGMNVATTTFSAQSSTVSLPPPAHLRSGPTSGSRAQANPPQYFSMATPRPPTLLEPDQANSEKSLEAPEVVKGNGEPPPLCPTLVMSLCDARFAVAMQSLTYVRTSFDVVGRTGTTLLRVDMQGPSTERSLAISMAHAGSTPLVTIRAKNAQYSKRRIAKGLEILGPDSAFYGDLALQPGDSYDVVKDNATVMKIQAASGSLMLNVTSGKGRYLASTTCSGEDFGGVDHLQIHVLAGIDAILVLACVLAIVLMPPTRTEL